MNGSMYDNAVYKTWLALMDKEEAQGFDGLSPAERAFWCVYLLDREACVHRHGFLVE